MQPAATSDQALSNLQAYTGSLQDPGAMQTANENQLGVGAAQGQVSGLRQAITNTTNLLNNVAPSVMGRTQNSLVTDAQANRQIQNESAPITKNLSDQTTKEAQAESDLSNLSSRASNLTTQQLTGQQTKAGLLKDIYTGLSSKEQAAADAAEKQREFQATQQLEQQKLAETAREANLSAATSSSKASQPSAAEIKQADMAGAAQYLSRLKGGDGHVSQQTWNTAYQQWTSAGYSSKDFVNQFLPYINQRYKGYAGFA